MTDRDRPDPREMDHVEVLPFAMAHRGSPLDPNPRWQPQPIALTRPLVLPLSARRLPSRLTVTRFPLAETDPNAELNPQTGRDRPDPPEMDKVEVLPFAMAHRGSVSAEHGLGQEKKVRSMTLDQWHTQIRTCLPRRGTIGSVEGAVS